MSVWTDATGSDDPTCGALGCTEPVEVVIERPKHGQRTVCHDHVNGHEVTRRV